MPRERQHPGPAQPRYAPEAIVSGASGTDPIDEALARSVVYRTLSLGLQRPDAAMPTRPGSAEAGAALRRATQLLGPPAVEEAAAALVGLTPPTPDELESAHSRLFGHSAGLVCPYETEYGPPGSFRQPHELADIAGCYRAFGLAPRTGVDERLDHVACECEFMDFLARKQAFALAALAAGSLPETEAREMHEVARDAARAFLRDHLGRFGRAFASRLRRADADGLLGALAGLLSAWLDAECQRFGVAAGPPTLAVRPPELDDTPMACGSCPAAPGAGPPAVAPQP